MSEPGNRLAPQPGFDVDQQLLGVNGPFQAIPDSLPCGPQSVSHVGHPGYGYDDCVKLHLRYQPAYIQSRCVRELRVDDHQVEVPGANLTCGLVGARNAYTVVFWRQRVRKQPQRLQIVFNYEYRSLTRLPGPPLVSSFTSVLALDNSTPELVASAQS